MESPEIDALINGFCTRKWKRILTLGLRVEGRAVLAGLETHCTTLDQARVADWGVDVIVLSNEVAPLLLHQLEACIEEAKPGTAYLVDFACPAWGTPALRQVLGLLGKPPLQSVSVAVEASNGPNVRVVLACRKVDDAHPEGAAPGSVGEQELMVWAIEPGSSHRSRIVEAAKSGKGPNFPGGRSARVQRLPWRLLSTPALVPHWIGMGREATVRGARLVPLGDVARIRAVSAPEDVERDVGAPSLLLGWVSRSIEHLSTATSAPTIASESLVVSIGSDEVSPDYLELHFRRFPDGSLFELPLGSGEERCRALGGLPLMVLTDERRGRFELGDQRARRALEQLHVLRGTIIQQRLALLSDEVTSLESEGRLRELEALLTAPVAQSLAEQVAGDAERLPAPLARALRTWQMGTSTVLKLKALLQFFEAAAELHATALLSGFLQGVLLSREVGVLVQGSHPRSNARRSEAGSRS
nr:hypothetical protein [Deltaproteobacteria bacterium]